jgi:GH24 family phage-related lysozyme (muramidase)
MDYQELKERIKEHEGYRNKVYLDSLGKRTIGYGHLCRADEKWDDDKQYDHRHLEKIFEYDFAIAQKGADEILKDCPNIHEKAREVVIECVFVLGKTGFSRFKRCIDALSKSEYQLASSELKDSVWYKNQATNRVHFLSQILEGIEQ